MALEKTTIVTIKGREYQISRLAPDIGSFILNKLLGAGVAASAAAPEVPAATRAALEEQAKKQTPEDTVRTLCGAAFFSAGGFDLETFRMVQRAAIAVCARMEGEATAKVPMPLANAAGQWAIAEVRDDIGLVSQLVTEALIFNFKSFFEQAGTTPTK